MVGVDQRDRHLVLMPRLDPAERQRGASNPRMAGNVLVGRCNTLATSCFFVPRNELGLEHHVPQVGRNGGGVRIAIVSYSWRPQINGVVRSVERDTFWIVGLRVLFVGAILDHLFELL